VTTIVTLVAAVGPNLIVRGQALNNAILCFCTPKGYSLYLLTRDLSTWAILTRNLLGPGAQLGKPEKALDWTKLCAILSGVPTFKKERGDISYGAI